MAGIVVCRITMGAEYPQEHREHLPFIGHKSEGITKSVIYNDKSIS